MFRSTRNNIFSIVRRNFEITPDLSILHIFGYSNLITFVEFDSFKGVICLLYQLDGHKDLSCQTSQYDPMSRYGEMNICFGWLKINLQ